MIKQNESIVKVDEADIRMRNFKSEKLFYSDMDEKVVIEILKEIRETL